MQTKLRPLGNSVGVAIPAHELRALDAKVGDLIEIEIKRVIRHVREGWDNPAVWAGADEDELLLKDAPATEFDNIEEWEW
ncbi:MAG: hypothetical protein P8Y45_04915 [Exilibacterium sp.]